MERLDKVPDADAYLQAHQDARAWLIACHPEVSFLRFEWGPAAPVEAEAKGVLGRLALIEREFPGTATVPRNHEVQESIPLAEALDAYAALWAALRVASGVVHPERDALGRDASGRCPRADGLLPRMVA
jgi:predicted RNase H-like nuclease